MLFFRHFIFFLTDNENENEWLAMFHSSREIRGVRIDGGYTYDIASQGRRINIHRMDISEIEKTNHSRNLRPRDPRERGVESIHSY